MDHEPRRARDLGIVPGSLRPGPLNALTDVPGVFVGHTTVDDGADLHTGVTAVLFSQLGAARRTLPCGLFVGNGHGKLVGATQVQELGVLETPILLTSTLSTFRAADALLTYMLAQPGYDDVRTLNPLVGETNDGFLSDIRRRAITEEHVLAALAAAGPELPAEGCVGAGTGTSALGFKSGVGTSSRVVAVDGSAVTLGALVQSNFSGLLTVLGVPMPADELVGVGDAAEMPDGNSCMIVLATDAPLDARRLARVARRAVFAMGRVGSDFGGGSGDYAVAVSTAPDDLALVPDSAMNGLFAAAIESVEEALLNSLFAATTTTGCGHVQHAVPHDQVEARLRERGVIG
ncbi:MAG: S58 family peptidase [Propionibacteriales bacterium]|nr:S58 family peptidase [Propionibacteriales bacterium]